MSPLSLRRQTPKEFVYAGRLDPRLGTLLWGLDTGTAVSTFRVSAATWVLLAAAIANVAPFWVGGAYAAGFLLPLAVALVVPLSESQTSRLLAALRRELWVAQGICAVALGILAGAALWG